jgi:hypothetical protein
VVFSFALCGVLIESLVERDLESIYFIVGKGRDLKVVSST